MDARSSRIELLQRESIVKRIVAQRRAIRVAIETFSDQYFTLSRSQNSACWIALARDREQQHIQLVAKIVAFVKRHRPQTPCEAAVDEFSEPVQIRSCQWRRCWGGASPATEHFSDGKESMERGCSAGVDAEMQKHLRAKRMKN